MYQSTREDKICTFRPNGGLKTATADGAIKSINKEINKGTLVKNAMTQLELRTVTTPNAGTDMEHQKFSLIADGNVQNGSADVEDSSTVS